MNCIKPFVAGAAAYDCGQCAPCRAARGRLWAHRLLLEGLVHEQSAFVTLTYDDAHVPAGGSLVVQHGSQWIKRLRKRIQPRKVRFFLCGEYGSRSWRPHYHAALFGFPGCEGRRVLAQEVCECGPCSVVRKAWGFGNVLVGQMTPRSALYIAGYVQKQSSMSLEKLSRDRLTPPFSRMSLRPGIGAHAMVPVASSVIRHRLEERGVPTHLRHGALSMALGRYLRRRLAAEIGTDDLSVAIETERLRLVREFAWRNNRSVASVFAELGEDCASRLEQKAAVRGSL